MQPYAFLGPFPKCFHLFCSSCDALGSWSVKLYETVAAMFEDFWQQWIKIRDHGKMYSFSQNWEQLSCRWVCFKVDCLLCCAERGNWLWWIWTKRQIVKVLGFGKHLAGNLLSEKFKWRFINRSENENNISGVDSSLSLYAEN